MDTLPPLTPVTPAITTFWGGLADARELAEKHQGPAEELRARLAAKHGEPRPYKSAEAEWGHDPDYAALSALNAMSDRFATLVSEQMDDVLDTPAVSIADLAYKLAVVAGVWRQTGGIAEDGDYHEKIALQFFEDAYRLLLPLMPAGC